MPECFRKIAHVSFSTLQKMRLLLSYILLALLLPISGMAQLRGEVHEKKSGAAIPFAVVFWEKSKQGTQADASGHFQLAWPDSLPDVLHIKLIGYTEVPIAFDKRAPTYIKVDLENANLGKEVVIEATKPAAQFSYIDPRPVEMLNSRSLLKAACCNLSESFETNPSVDAAVTDAVSGARKIQLLGLDGVYTQILFENLPLIRGLSSSYGLNYVPGSWVNSIQITKGTGSVVNGYESVSGQLNIALLQPADADYRLFVNLYGSHRGRYEANVHLAQKMKNNWGTLLLLHASQSQQRWDQNSDGFLDMPLTKQANVMNRWNWQTTKLEGQFGFRMVSEDRRGGQFNFDVKRDYGTHNFYGVGIKNNLFEVFNKTGIVFPKRPGRSIGTMASLRYHTQDMYFGVRRYTGVQQSAYVNVIYQDYIKNTNHVVKAGASFVYDDYDESYNDSAFARTELVPGIFAEYTGHLSEKFSLVAGVRGDAHSLAGFRVTPRLHLKYDITPKTILRASGGSAFRTANVFAENSVVFASSRVLQITENLRAESAWNYGLSLLHNFTLFKKSVTLNIDFFRTDFVNQVVVDRETPGILKIYNLNGQSYANSFQADVLATPIERFEIRLAYKFYDVRTTYGNYLRTKPLQSRQRALINLAYALPYDKWMFDATAKWLGTSRLQPVLSAHHTVSNLSDAYWLFSGQVTRKFRLFDVYLGVENLLNFMQHEPIIEPENPFGAGFDASRIYAPTDGRVIYIGLRTQF